MKTVLLITHEETTASDYGYVASYLRELGHKVVHHEVLKATENHDGWIDANVDFPSLEGIDSLIIFGSFTHAYAESTRHWVEKEIELIKTAREAGTPYLGICFGAQLLAEALGGKIVKGPRMEVGLIDFETFEGCPTASGPWFSWHHDRVELPGDVEILAKNDMATQVFKSGNSLGVQFHPEVNDELIEEWLRTGGDQLEGALSPDVIREQWVDQGKYAQAHGRELIDWFMTVEPAKVPN